MRIRSRPATTFLATRAVVQRAVDVGANLIITHEPVYYGHRDEVDWLADDPVYQAKRRLIDDLLSLSRVEGEERMRRLNEERKVTFLFSSHDGMVLEKARRVIRLRDGQVEGDGRGCREGAA